MAADRRLIKRILRRLSKAYGPRPWKCRGKGVDVLIDTILSQNTSNKNSDAGFANLRRRFRTWNQVADAPVQAVEEAIRISGLSRIKAPRIQQILRQIRGDFGKTDLQHLAAKPVQEALEYLLRFPGVGPKTACCVLLFAFGSPVFPVDTHIHRIARRLGWIAEKTSADAAHDLLTPLIAPGDRYSMHVLLIEHGRRTCRAIAPRCRECALLQVCPAGQVRVKQEDSTNEPVERERLGALIRRGVVKRISGRGPT